MALIKRYGVYYADFRVPNGKRSRTSLQTTNLRVAKDKYAEIVSRRKKAKENPCYDARKITGGHPQKGGAHGLVKVSGASKLSQAFQYLKGRRKYQ